MKRLLLITLLMASSGLAGEADKEAAAPPPSEEVSRSNDTFVPSEQVDADAVVPFPADI